MCVRVGRGEGELHLRCLCTTCPMLHPMLRIPLPLPTHPFTPPHFQVRRAAANIVPELLHSLVSAAEKGAPGIGPANVKALLDYIWLPLIEALGKV